MSCQWSQFSICSMPLAYPLWIKRSQCPRCRKPSWQPWRTKVFQASNASQRWRSSRRWLDETRIRLGSDSIDCRLPGCDLHASRLDETVHSQEPRTSEKRVPCWTGKIWEGPESGYEGHKVNRKLESLQRNLWTTRQWDQTQRKGDSLALHSPKQSSVVGEILWEALAKKTQSKAYTKATRRHTAHTEIVWMSLTHPTAEWILGQGRLTSNRLWATAATAATALSKVNWMIGLLHIFDWALA